MRCGFIALLGRPNVGKSTLMNALVGAKLAGVSDKAQTTRNKIVGIWIEGDSQLAFLDTPGLHDESGRAALNQLMIKEAWRALSDADFAVYLIDGLSGVVDEDLLYLRKLTERSSRPVYYLISKGDLLKKKAREHALDTARQSLQEFSPDKLRPFEDVVYSAKKPGDISAIRARFAAEVPQGPWLYDAEQLTDRSQKFIVGEYIREQLFRLLGDELPYGAGVIVEQIDFRDSPVYVLADIYVERESQKRMVIGKAGQKIRKIGQNARTAIEKLFDDRVYVELFVKVKPGWVNKQGLIAEISGLSASDD